MNNNKLLAEALLDIAKNSETTFVEVVDDKELIEAAQKLGIVLPSPDLAVLKTVYAEVDKVNKNGVVLPKDAAEKGLPTLIGKQINWEHEGSGRVCGYIIDAKINNGLIEVIGVIFKSLFPEEMLKVKEKFASKDLCVSFEIWNRSPETGESVVHELENGFRSINPITFHGCGLLLVNPPACPKAKVYQLVAKVLKETEKIVNKVFGEDLIFASLAIEQSACKNCGTCTCKKEDKIVDALYELVIADVSLDLTEDDIITFENDYDESFDEAKKLKYEEKQKLSDDDFAVVVTVKNKVTGEPRKIRMFPIHDEAHVRNALARLPQAAETLKKLGISQETVLNKILKRAKELNMTELLKRHEKAEGVTYRICPECQQPLTDEEVEVCAVCKKKKIEAKLCPECQQPLSEDEEDICSKCKTKKAEQSSEETQTEAKTEETKTEEKSEVAETKSEEVAVEETKEEIIEVVKVEEVVVAVTYTEAQVEEKIQTSIDELIAALPKEVSDRIKELVKDGKSVKEAMKQAWEEYKKSQEKALEEKDKEIAKTQEELGKKSQELDKIKLEIAAQTKKDEQPSLGVGYVGRSVDEYQEIKKNINKRAFGHE